MHMDKVNLVSLIEVYIGGEFMPHKICKLCGKEFYTVSTGMYCKGPHYASCEVCGATFEIKDPVQPQRTCSKECKVQLRKINIAKTPRKCKLCGKLFYSSSNTAQYCTGPHYQPCPICDKPVEVKDPGVSPGCCSIECSNKLREQTCLDTYGVRIVSQSSQVKQKLHDKAIASESSRAAHVQQKYGIQYTNVAQVPEIKKKISETISSNECQAKMRASTLRKFGTPYAMQSAEGIAKHSESIKSKYGVPYYVMSEECRAKTGQIISKLNRDFGRLLADNGIEYAFEHRIDTYSYDLYLPSLNTLIEINPTYTHNSEGNHWGKIVETDYHMNKTKLARDHGFRCINIWDWDDWNQIVKLLTHKIRIYGRNCEVHEISAKLANEFESQHHLQRGVRGQRVCLGLYHNDELVGVMSFGHPRYNNQYEWELLRLCYDSKYVVIGGSAKLWKAFLQSQHPQSVISYCDLAKFSGHVYTQLGMVLDHINTPNKVWSKGSKCITNNLLLQRGYDQLFHTNYGKGTSNEQLMLNDGWLPVYDCGQAVYVYNTDSM